MLVIVLSGLYLTNAVAPEYLNALALPYGQAIPMIHQGYENAELQLRLNAMIFIYIVIALGYIAAIFYLFQKNKNAYLAVSLSVLLVIALYVIVMTTVA